MCRRLGATGGVSSTSQAARWLRADPRRTSIDAHESQLTAEVDSVTIEEEARCTRVLLAPLTSGTPLGSRTPR